MKKVLLAMFATLLIVAISLPTMALAFTGDVLANPSYSIEQDGFVYKEKSFTEGGKIQMAFYGEYNPTVAGAKYELVIHSIRNKSVTTRTTVMDIAKDYERTTGRKVMLATNGDYFDYNTGTNMESYVNDGIVLTKGAFATKHCIGFDNNGKVAVGRMTSTEPRLLVMVEGEKHFFKIDKFNTQPASNELAVYTSSGSHTVTNAGVRIIQTDSANLNNYPVWGKDKWLMEKPIADSNTFTLKSGEFAFVYTAGDQKFFEEEYQQYGSEVDIVEIPAGDFAGCTWVLGGYDVLVNNGVVNTSCHTDNDGNGNAPRTFIGFKEDGTAFLCMLDGRKAGYAVGITVNQEAQLASVLGAKYALELDGGGSTTTIVRINDQLELRNKPSDGSMRKVSNAIMIVEKPAQEQENPGEDTPSTPVTPTDPATPTDPVTPGEGGNQGGNGGNSGEGTNVTPPADNNSGGSSNGMKPPAITKDLIIGLSIAGAVVIISVVVVIVLLKRKKNK